MQPIQIKLQRTYSNKHDENSFSVARLHNSHIANLGGKESWVKISSQKKYIFRKIKGAGNLAIPINGIELDFHGLDDLGWSTDPEGNFYKTTLTITKASWFDRLVFAHTKHPDPSYSQSMKLGLIGLALGVTGLILGLISLYLTYHPPVLGVIAS